MTIEARRALIEEAVAVAESDPGVERLRLPWQGQYHNCPVVTLPLDAVVLNPRSHRVRAQLSSSPVYEVVESDPESDEAQGLLAQLLRSTNPPAYERLLESIRTGQQDPGAVTRTGLLVNGNTRAVALRETGEPRIRVAVLPRGTQQDINELELFLQVKPDLKIDYTYTNRLLFVEELLDEYHYTPERVARMAGYAESEEVSALSAGVKQVAQDQRVLAIIRELQELSSGSIPLTLFDAKRQALLEIDDEYERGKLRDSASASRIRALRLAGLLSDVGYRELRRVDDEFLETYLIPEVDDHEWLGRVLEELPDSTSSDVDSELGLDVLGGDGEAANDLAENLLSFVAESFQGRDVELPLAGNRITVPRSELLGLLGSAFEAGAEQAALDARRGDALERPIKRVREATKKAQTALSDFGKVASRSGFNRGGFQLAVKRLTRVAKELRDAADAQ